MSKVSGSSYNKGESKKRFGNAKPQPVNKIDSDINIAITGSPPIIPWPEWNDSEINLEKWDCKTVDTRKKNATTQPAVSSSLSEVLLFEDDPLTLPASWKVHAWRRPAELFTAEEDDFVLYVDSRDLSIHELVSLNHHVVHNEFIRSFLSAVLTVWHLGTYDTFPIEGESTTFVSNTKHLHWRPWHHIYSLCKAGRTFHHTPVINPSGKYIVRLYFMGCWRKIMVDDKIPVDIDGKVLLPLTSERNEIWALLLAKAMLKLACYTWTNEKELVEFNPVYCLTGWIVQECDTEGMKIEEVWEVCNNFVKRFPEASVEENAEIADESKSLSGVRSIKLGEGGNSTHIADKSSSKMFKQSRLGKGMSKNTSFKGSMMSSVKQSILKKPLGVGSKLKGSSRMSANTKSSNFDSRKGAPQSGSSRGKSMSDSSPKTGRKTLPDENKHNTGPVLFGVLSENWPMMNDPELFESPLTLSHPFLILQTRDTQFVCQKPRPGVPGWKRHRWIEWATTRGLFDPDMLLPFRSLQIVSLFNEWFDKIEEKDNPDALNGLSIEGIHACGDQGGSTHTHITLTHDHKYEEYNEYDVSRTLKQSANPITLRANNAGGAKHKGSSKKLKGGSRPSFMSTSNKTRLSYLVTIMSHESAQYVKSARQGESAVQKCGAAIWTDFNHIWSSLEKMLVFYKPSGFRYKLNIANVALNRETPVARRKIAGDKKPVVDPIQYVTIPFTVQRSRNDGLYLMFDSGDCIKVLFMLSTVPENVLQPMKNATGNDKGNPVNETNPNGCIPRKRAAPVNVVIEVYNWASNQFNETVLVLETFGSKSATLNLGKGRHTLRVWIKTNTAFVLNCLSETLIVTGNRYNIDNAISNESERVKFFSQQIRNKLSYMFVTFGKQTFSNALHTAFQTINDFCTNHNKEYIHDIFMDAIVATFKQLMVPGKEMDEYIFALRVFFLNVSLGMDKDVKPLLGEVGTKVFTSFTEGESAEKQVIDYDKYMDGDWITSPATLFLDPSLEGRYQDAAYLIQATWKRYYAMKLMKIHRNTNTKEHKLVVERLKKLHETLFGPATYGDVILKILVTMLDLEPDIAKWLPLYHDLGFIVKVEEWRGVVVNISQNMWIPVVRTVVRCHSDTPIIGVVNVICQCARYMVRVIDNDNLLEKPRQVFNVEPCTYTKNTNGYTLFVYAWSEMPQKKEIQWKLEIVTLKHNPYIHSCTQIKEDACSVNKPPALMTLEISNYYIPNNENLMCRLLITIKTKMLLSFRLTSSFSGVRFTVCLQDKDGFPLMHAQAEAGAVIIPAALLEKEPNSKETLYIIEAKVIRDSWPLTRQEWIVLERIKNEYIPHRERTVIYKSTSRLSLSTTTSKKLDLPKQQTEQKRNLTKKRKESRHELQMENPFWTLQTVIDYHQREFIKVKQDNRREEAVKAMKQAWEAADPGRAKRGHELRDQFINDIYGVKHDTTSSKRQLLLREKIFGKQVDSSTKIKEVEEECTERFHSPPVEFAIAQSKAHFLQIISEYYLDAKPCETPKVKTREDHEREILENRKREDEFEQERHNDIEEREKILVEQHRKHKMMHDHYARTRYESRLRMQTAYEVRDEFVRQKIEEEEERMRLEAFLKKRRKKLSSKRTSEKSSRKSSPKKKDKKSTKSYGSSVKSLK